MPDPEPIRDLAHLGHVELLTPKLEQSRAFFLDVFGLYEAAVEGDSVYLRGYGDHDRTTLKLTAAPEAGLGHIGWRAISPQALERRVAAIEQAGLGDGWGPGDVGHGSAYRFTDPDGHRMELYYESERFRAPAGQESYLLNQPQAFRARGACARRLDHLNVFCRDVEANASFLRDVLGFRLIEQIVRDERQIAAWMSVTPQPHDIALTLDRTGSAGRLHHVTYWLDSREDVLRAADLMMEHGVPIEAGPAKHSRTQGFFLYVYEPGGNRVELFSGGFPIYAPDWEAVTWTPTSLARGTAWGADVPDSFHTYGTPPVTAAVPAA